MKKQDIIDILNKIDISKDKFIVIGESALVLLGAKRNCTDLIISTKNNISFDNINVTTDFFDLKRVKEVDGIFVADLEACFDYFITKDDKKMSKKIRLMIDSSDNYKYERELRANGVKYIAGVDEVGRGPLVGPVVTACVVLPENFDLDGLTDSKKLSEKKRDLLYEKIKEQALGIGVGMCSPEEIDEYNIYNATKIAMKRAIDECKRSCPIEHVLIDAMKLDLDIPTTSIIKGDLLSITISAASVIAKVTRDQMMYDLDEKYPMYDFKDNVGYPTKKHMEAIEEYGILKEHRKSFGPVKDYILNHGDKTIN